jgi:hypothetical protein
MSMFGKIITEEELFKDLNIKYFESEYDSLMDLILNLPEKTDNIYYQKQIEKYTIISEKVNIKLGNTILIHNKKFSNFF